MKKTNFILLSVVATVQITSVSVAFAKGPSNSELLRKFNQLNADYQAFQARPKATVQKNTTPLTQVAPAPIQVASPVNKNPIRAKDLIQLRREREQEQNRARVEQMRAEKSRAREVRIQNLKAKRQLVIDQAKKDKEVLNQRKLINHGGLKNSEAKKPQIKNDPMVEAKDIVRQAINYKKQQLVKKEVQAKPLENNPQVKAAQSIKPSPNLSTVQQLEQVKKFIRQVKAYKFKNQKA
jgi:hypothetical protein